MMNKKINKKYSKFTSKYKKINKIKFTSDTHCVFFLLKNQ